METDSMGRIVTLLLLCVLCLTLTSGEDSSQDERRSVAGPFTLLINSRKTARNTEHNNTSNIHDYFRHVFIRKNMTTDNDHQSASPEKQAKVSETKKKKKDQKKKKVISLKPNLSNIHDFFRHVFIRKNATSTVANPFINTPTTIAAYDVAHGKVKNIHRKRISPYRPLKSSKKKKSKIKRKAHKKHHRVQKKKAKSRTIIDSRVLITPTKSESRDGGDITLKSKPDPPPKISESPQKESSDNMHSDPATQFLRGDEVIEPTSMVQPNERFVPTYANVQMNPLYNSNNLAPTTSRIRWLINKNANPSGFNNVQTLNTNPPFGFLSRIRSARIGPTLLSIGNVGNIVPTSGLTHYDHIAPHETMDLQRLMQENVGFALGEAPTTSSLNPINAKLIRRKHPPDLSTIHMKAEYNPVDKKNLVQFRDSSGRVIATLRDPKTWNSANVTLSKSDDRRRYMNDIHELQTEGVLKSGIPQKKSNAISPDTWSPAMARTLSQQVVDEYTPLKGPVIPRKIAIMASNTSSKIQEPFVGPKTRTDQDGDRVISYHAYRPKAVPVKRGGIHESNDILRGADTQAHFFLKSRYDIGDDAIAKRDFIYPHPSYNSEDRKREMITAINGIEQPNTEVEPQQQKRSFDRAEIEDDVTGNILDEKDRQYLSDLLSKLRRDSMIEHMGVRRDDIPGGKNNHQILTKVTKFMGDVEKFIKNVEIISSTFGKDYITFFGHNMTRNDKQIPSKLMKFIVHVEKFIDDIENITTSFGNGPIKRKQKSKEFLIKLQRLVKDQKMNGQSIFDLFQGNATNATQKEYNMTGNLYSQTVDFLKDEVSEIEEIRSMLKMEDERLNNATGAENGSKLNGSQTSNFNTVLNNVDKTDTDQAVLKYPLEKKEEKFNEKMINGKNVADNGLIGKGKKVIGNKHKTNKSNDIASMIPLEATSANPDEAKMEGKFTSKGAKDDGTVFSPIIPEDEEKKNSTLAITPAKLTEGMLSSKNLSIDQISGSKQQQSMTKDELDDDDDADLQKAEPEEINKEEKTEELNLFEVNGTSTNAMKEKGDGTKEGHKNTQESTTSKNIANFIKAKIDADSPMIITPKLFKESIHEAIRQFARRMNLKTPITEANADRLDKIDRNEKSLIQVQANSTDYDINELEDPEILRTDEKEAVKNNTSAENLFSDLSSQCLKTQNLECENKTTVTIRTDNNTSRRNRLFEFFSKSKQASLIQKYNNTPQVDDYINSAVNWEPVAHPLEQEASMRKSFFSQREDGNKLTHEPVLSVASDYNPLMSNEHLQLFPEYYKKSVTNQGAKLSAATPYKEQPKDNKEEEPHTNQTAEYLKNISREMTSAEEEIQHESFTSHRKGPFANTQRNEPLNAPKKLSSETNNSPSKGSSKHVNGFKSSSSNLKEVGKEAINRHYKVLSSHPSFNTGTESSLKNKTKQAVKRKANSTSLPLRAYLFSYSNELARYNTPCVRACLQDGTVLGMCARSCTQDNPNSPVRRHVNLANASSISHRSKEYRMNGHHEHTGLAPVRSIHLSQPEPYNTESELNNGKIDSGEITSRKNPQTAPVHQFIDEEGNILEQNQDHVTTTVRLNNDTLDEVDALPPSELSETAKLNENLQRIGLNNFIENNNKNDILYPNKQNANSNTNNDNSHENSEWPPVNLTEDVSLYRTSEQNSSLPITIESDVCKDGMCNGSLTNSGEKKYYCQDRPCFSLKDIWKMLHCNHPPCFKEIFQPHKALTLNRTLDVTDSQPLKISNFDNTGNLLTKVQYNRILAQQKKAKNEAHVSPVQELLTDPLKLKVLPYTDPDDNEKYGPLASDKFSQSPSGSLPGTTAHSNFPSLDDPSLEFPNNKIVAFADPASKLPLYPEIIADKIPAFSETTANKLPELTEATSLTEPSDKVTPFPQSSNLRPTIISDVSKCSCAVDENFGRQSGQCQRRCFIRKKPLPLLKAKQKVVLPTTPLLQKPIVVMIKPQPKKPLVQNRTSRAKVCRSWTYFPYFTCLLESPVTAPYIKRKHFNGPYDNCRTLPTFPFFKCYSNGLSEVLPAQRHKISKILIKSSKTTERATKKTKTAPAININNKMSDAVAKAMLENANRVSSNKKKTSLSKPNANDNQEKTGSKGNKIKQKDVVKKAPKKDKVVQLPANKQKTQQKTKVAKSPLPPGLVTGLELGKRILASSKANPSPLLAIKSLLPGAKKSSTPNSIQSTTSKPTIPFNVKYMLQLPQTKLFVPYRGGIAPNSNIIKPFSSLEASSKTEAGLSPLSMAKRTMDSVQVSPAKRTFLKKSPRAKSPKERKTKNETSVSKDLEKPEKNILESFPPGFNPKTDFNGYINALLAQRKVKEAELFKKILRVIMSSPKSRKYNRKGGDPWKYIYPALKWVEEYENVWKPKFKDARNVKPSEISKKMKQKKTSQTKHPRLSGTKKTNVPRVAGASIANELYSVTSLNDNDKKYLFQEEPTLSLDNVADDEEIQSLGFTTGENAEFSKDMYL